MVENCEHILIGAGPGQNGEYFCRCEICGVLVDVSKIPM